MKLISNWKQLPRMLSFNLAALFAFVAAVWAAIPPEAVTAIVPIQYQPIVFAAGYAIIAIARALKQPGLEAERDYYEHRAKAMDDDDLADSISRSLPPSGKLL